MAQKEVEDIFAKTMAKNTFKAATTLKLARTFLSKHKVMETWKEDVEPESPMKSKHPVKIKEEPESSREPSDMAGRSRSNKGSQKHSSNAITPTRSQN